MSQFKKNRPITAEIATRVEQVNLVWSDAEVGDGDMVEKLSSYKADLNRHDLRGYTPIDIASQNGHVDVIRGLVQLGVKIDPDVAIIAARNGHHAVITELVKLGADFSATLCLLASLTIIPGIIIATATVDGHGYLGTFFNTPVTGMPEQLETLEKPIQKI